MSSGWLHVIPYQKSHSKRGLYVDERHIVVALYDVFCKMVNFGPINTKFAKLCFRPHKRYKTNYVVIGAIALLLWLFLWPFYGSIMS